MTASPECECYNCLKQRSEEEGNPFLLMTKFIACEKCGNKRCPHATDHNLPCSGSNLPGQLGSIYA